MNSCKHLVIILFSLGSSWLFAQESFIKLPNEDLNLFVEDVGNGQPVIFIPGWTMTTEFFKHQKDHYAKEFRYVSYDPRSQGKSTKTENGNTYEVHAQDLHHLITELKLENAILVGWSSGCATIFEYVQQYGTKSLDQLVFIDEPPKWIGDSETEWVYGTFDGYRGSLKNLLNDPEGYAKAVVDWMLETEISKTVEDWMIAETLQTPKYAALSLYIDGLISDYNEIVKSIDGKIPALYMVRDNWYNDASHWLHTHAPNAKTVPITSHAMFWENPEKFNQLLDGFLNSNTTK